MSNYKEKLLAQIKKAMNEKENKENKKGEEDIVSLSNIFFEKPKYSKSSGKYDNFKYVG